MQNALGLSRGTGGIEDEQGVLGVHHLRRAVFRLGVHEVGEPVISSRTHGNVCTGSLYHQHMLYAICTGRRQCEINV